MTDRNSKCRTLYIIEALLEYMITLLISGTFLSALLKQIGVSDALTGVVSSLISLSFCVQLFSGSVPPKNHSTRRTILFFDLVCQFLYSSLYLIPFLPFSTAFKTVVFFFTMLSAQLLQKLASPSKYRWLMYFVDETQRGTFTSRKEIVSLFGSMIYTLLMGRMIDHYKYAGKEQIGLLLCAAILFTVTFLNAVTLCLVNDEPESYRTKKNAPVLKEVSSLLISSRPLRRIILLDILWKSCTYIFTPYLGTYLIGDLGYTLSAVSIIAIFHSLARAVFSFWLGRLADRKGRVHVITLCMGAVAAACFICAFLRPETRWFYIVYIILYSFTLAGTDNALTNMTYDYLGDNNFTIAYGARNAISGLVAFLVSLIGSAIVKTVQANSNMVFGAHIYAQQILASIAFLLAFAAVIYTQTIIKALPRYTESINIRP